MANAEKKLHPTRLADVPDGESRAGVYYGAEDSDDPFNKWDVRSPMSDLHDEYVFSIFYFGEPVKHDILLEPTEDQIGAEVYVKEEPGKVVALCKQPEDRAAAGPGEARWSADDEKLFERAVAEIAADLFGESVLTRMR